MEILIDAVLKVLDDDSDHGFQIVTGKVFRLNGSNGDKQNAGMSCSVD